MKNIRKKVTAFVLAAVICLSAGAIATTSASAAEIDSHFVQVQNTMPMLRNGIWLSTGANGHFEYIEIHNSVNKMHIVSSENMMGVSGEFDYESITGVYTVHPGCITQTETWTLSKNDGATAEITMDDGSCRTLFFLGGGNLDNVFSLNDLSSMAQNYFEIRNGADESVRFVAVMRANCSGLADIRVIKYYGGRAYTIETFTIDIRSGGGWDTAENVIDFTYFA